jgi:4-hydroxy-tetrahydrodipicolinate synthase
MFKGIYTAIITPFQNGKVDEKKLEELVSLQVEAGVKGVIPCGTTGEFLYLSEDEQRQIIDICVRVCKGKTKVVPGTATLSISETIAKTQKAQKAGADGVLIVTPWYIKPTQESLHKYYKDVAENVDLPIIIYNNPSRTGVDISLETMEKLASYKNIQGYKDSSSNLPRTTEFKCRLGNRFSLLAGNDDPFAAYLAMGGDGGILGISNLIPQTLTDLMEAWEKGDLKTFRDIWEKIFPLMTALYLESIPYPLKYAMTLVHGVSSETRLPFGPLRESTRIAIEKELENLGLWEPLASVRER